MAERDRDESGRPRSTRPRDALGRPLPPGSEGDRVAPYAIDAAHLVAYADALIADLAAGAEITPKRLRPRLVAVLPQ